jgi:hypothetical protein
MKSFDYEKATFAELIDIIFKGRFYDLNRVVAEALKRTSNKSYKNYVALLTQTGTGAPTAIELENTLGGNVTWVRTDIGEYEAHTSNLFPKLVGGFVQDTNVCYRRLQKIDDSTVRLTTFAANAQVSDGLLTNALIEIRVYT